MAHELAFFTDGRARLAYCGETPWHSLGTQLTPDASIETWARESGMDFEILGAPVTFKAASGKTYAQGTRQVLYRADTDEPLGVVGNKYKVVQPITILEFFRNLVADQGFELETAGVLFNGSKYFAMARTGNELKLAGDDKVRQFLLLMTACDGSLRTTAKMVETRVVCNNTIQQAAAEGGGAEVKVSHSSTFDAGQVQMDMGVFNDLWKARAVQMRALSKAKISAEQAIRFVVDLVGDNARPLEDNKSIPAVGKILGLYAGNGRGSELASAHGTAWGIVNAISEYTDYHIGKDQNRRLESAYAYGGANLKMAAFEKAMAFVTA